MLEIPVGNIEKRTGEITFKNMQTTARYQPFNATQLHLLKMFSFTQTEQTLQDLKKLLRDFYIQQVEKEVDKYQIDDHILNEHLRTPYR